MHYEMEVIQRRRRQLFINLTSFIDILFIILLFFTVSSTFVKGAALKVSLPNAKGETVLQDNKSIDIAVTVDQRIFLNGSPVEVKMLKDRIKTVIKELNNDNPEVQFKVDEGVPYGFAIQVMSEIKSTGIKTVLAMTQSKGQNVK